MQTLLTKIIAWCAVLVLGLLLSACLNYSDAIGLYNEARYEDARRQFEKLAKKGDPASQYMLARIWEEGQGVRKDVVKAAKLYAQAAESATGARSTTAPRASGPRRSC